MDVRQLRYFAKVVESGSFSKAANQLHVAQPALSQHVRNMEEELGVTLLEHNSQGRLGNGGGRSAHGPRQAYPGRVRRNRRQRSQRGLAPRGEVCFGMPGTVSELLAAPLIEATAPEYPMCASASRRR